MLRSTVRCRKHGELTIIVNLAPGLLMNLRVTLLNQPKYLCCGGISPTTTSKRRWRRLPQLSICTPCLRIQLTPTFPLKSILCRTSLVSTSRRISWIIPNWQTTRSGVCFSIMWKHISGTVAVHTTLFATHHSKRSSNSASYGCHTTYNSGKTSTQHISQVVYISKFTKPIRLFLRSCKTGHFHTWPGNIEAICSWYLSLKMWAGLFFLFGTHNHLQHLRTRDQYVELSY